MGRFTYENSTKLDLEDRVLAHLQIVIGSKLRRSEGFYFTWREDTSVGDGRISVWVHPRASLVFKFHGSRTPKLNRSWLEALTYNANSPRGLYISPEPAEMAAHDEEAAFG